MNSDQQLDKCRQQIDMLDGKILKLLNDRAVIAKLIGKIKASVKSEVFSPDREIKILNQLAEKNKGPLSEEAINDIFQTIFVACRSLQKRIQIAYLGPEATYTHQMAIKHFGRGADFIAMPSISDVFFEVERKRVDYGVVPIENSTEGVVNHTLDMFVESNLHIISEREEPISHALMSTSGNIKNVKTVYSHAQALAQCRKWLDSHLPGVAIEGAASTADAAVRAALDANSAAIASQLAAQIYHLKPIALKIEDSPENATRFLVIGRETAKPTKRDKTSVLFSLKDRVGALYEVLEPFRSHNINLTKIESRPTKKKAWQYVFYVDFLGHQSEPKIQKAIAQLEQKCASLKILGSYPYGN
ncbi:MAG: prephenate dehydratase [Elusimicrobiota bacterium]